MVIHTHDVEMVEKLEIKNNRKEYSAKSSLE